MNSSLTEDVSNEGVSELRVQVHKKVLQLFRDSNLPTNQGFFISANLMATCIRQLGLTTDVMIPVIHKMLDEMLKGIELNFNLPGDINEQ